MLLAKSDLLLLHLTSAGQIDMNQTSSAISTSGPEYGQMCGSFSENVNLISKIPAKHGGARANSGGKRAGAGRPFKAKQPAQIAAPAQSIGERWYIFEASHKKLSTALHELALLGFNTYLPTHPVKSREIVRGRKTGKMVTLLKPMFFHFAFFSCNLADHTWHRARSAPGVKRLITSQMGIPVAADRGLVEALIADEPNRIKLPEPGMPRLKKGELALVNAGPFAGKVGKVERCDGKTTILLLTLDNGGTIKANIRRNIVSAE